MLGKKKGQTAMEYLMTYGWAILAVIIIGGVLYGLGVFSPQVPKQGCPTGVITIQAADWNYKANGDFDLIVGNNVGAEITVTQVNVTEAGTTQGAAPGETVTQGDESSTITVSNLPTGSTGDTVTPTVVVTYDVTDGLSGQKASCDLRGSIS